MGLCEPLSASVCAHRAWYWGFGKTNGLEGLMFCEVSIRFVKFGTTNGLEEFVFYRVSVYVAFGVVREFSALLSILLFLGFKLMKT